MKAILQKRLEDGSYVSIGTEGQHITKEYKSYNTLYKYGIKPMLNNWKLGLRAEIYYNWDNRYGEPSRVVCYIPFEVFIHGNKMNTFYPEEDKTI